VYYWSYVEIQNSLSCKLSICCHLFFHTLCIKCLCPDRCWSCLRISSTGKIQVDEILRPGTIYELPPLTVVNTGDEKAEYRVGTAYREKQKELAPPKEWFTFSPAKFTLKPEETQTVDIKLHLPLRVEPGDYFAFLEGSPTKRVNKGGAVVGVAAAAKLYFTVEPANILSAVYYKTLSFWKVYDPWPKVLLTVGIVLYVIYLFRKRFNIQISSKKSIHKDTESHE